MNSAVTLHDIQQLTLNIGQDVFYLSAATHK